jgi:hypothetical protein
MYCLNHLIYIVSGIWYLEISQAASKNTEIYPRTLTLFVYLLYKQQQQQHQQEHSFKCINYEILSGMMMPTSIRVSLVHLSS